MDVNELRARAAALNQSSLRKEVVNEIAKHVQHVQDLRTYLNTLAPISVLPSELLSEIFMDLASESHAGGSTSGRGTYRWIVVSHVCKGWRQVALGCLDLWRNIIVTKQCEWMRTLLERSKDTPLIVSINPLLSHAYREESAAAARLVLSHLPRICALSFGISSHMEGYLEEPFTGDAPLLEELRIDNRYSDSLITLRLLQCFDRLLHHPSAQRLEQLVVYHCKLGWETISLPNLTVLALTGGCLEMTGLLNVLAATPLLETLCLHYAFIAKGVERSAVLTTKLRPLIALTQLHTIDLYDRQDTLCTLLLSHLDCRTLKYLHVKIDAHMQPITYKSLFSAIAQTGYALGQLQTVAVHTVSPSPQLGGSCDVCAFNEVIERRDGIHENLFSHKGGPNLRIWLRSITKHVVALTTLFQLLPFNNARSLFVTDSPSRPWFWRVLSTHMEAVTRLHFAQSRQIKSADVFPVHALLPTWEPALSAETSGEQPQDVNSQISSDSDAYPFPQLRTLTLYHSVVPGLQLEHKEPAQMPLVTQLLDCFIERYEGGAEIETLRFLSDPPIAIHDLRRLQEVVRFVECE